MDDLGKTLVNLIKTSAVLAVAGVVVVVVGRGIDEWWKKRTAKESATT